MISMMMMVTSEQGTTIRWFRDGLQIAQINDMKAVPNVWISKNQQWESRSNSF